MKAYIGDLDKKEVLERIYNNFYLKFKRQNPYLNLNDDLYTLSDDMLNNLLQVTYIGYVNGLYLNMEYIDDDLEFNANYSDIYLQTLFDMKLEKAIIYETPTNSKVFSDLRVLTKDIELLRSKIEENNRKISSLSLNNEFYKNKPSSLLRNTVFDINMLQCRKIWMDTKKMEIELIEKVGRKRRIILDLVNLKTYSIGR